MMLGFKTTEQLNKMRQESTEARMALMDMEQTKRVFNTFNDYKFHTGLEVNSSTGKLEGQLVTVVTDRKDPAYGQLRYSDPIESSILKKMGGSKLNDLVDSKMVDQMLRGVSPEREIEQYLSDVALVSASKRVIPLITNTIRAQISDMFKAQKVSSKSLTYIQNAIGDLETNLTGLMQQSIKLGKHSSGIVSAYDVIDLWKNMNNPNSMTMESWDSLKHKLRDTWDTEIQKERAESVLDAVMGKQAALKTLTTLDPNAKNVYDVERSVLMGGTLSAPEIGEYVSRIHDRKGTRLNQFANDYYKAMRSAGFWDIGRISDGNKARNLLKAAIDESTSMTVESIRRPSILGGWFGSKAVGMKGKIAKFGAVGAMAYLAANFFRPNQLSNSMNPADAFIDLGTDSGGDNNFWKSELQLAKGVPLDSVVSRWDKSARLRPEADFDDYKEQKSEIFNSLLNNRLYNTFGLQLTTNSQANMSYTNYTNKTGYFNSYDFSRWIKKDGNNRS